MTEMNGNIPTEVIEVIDEPMELTDENGAKVILVKVATTVAKNAIPFGLGVGAGKVWADSKEKKPKLTREERKAERAAAKAAKKAAKANRPKTHIEVQLPGIRVYKDTPAAPEVQPENSEKNSDN